MLFFFQGKTKRKNALLPTPMLVQHLGAMYVACTASSGLCVACRACLFFPLTDLFGLSFFAHLRIISNNYNTINKE